MDNTFNTVLAVRPNSNRFDLSHDVKMSFRMGRLYPICVLDAIPGDKFNISTESLLRMSPMVAPVMHELVVKTEFFFVPNRLLWDEWEDFISNDGTELVPPYILNDDGIGGQIFSAGMLADYMGIPPEIPSNMRMDAMPFAAYALIWDEWYRDQDLVTNERFEPLVEGDNSANYTTQVAAQAPLPRSWPHDYFTSARPWPQKGDAVSLPLVDGYADVILEPDYVTTGDEMQFRVLATGNLASPSSPSDITVDPGGNMEMGSGQTPVVLDPNGVLVADVNSGAVQINMLREAFRLQEFLEIDSAGGTRYTETIRAHFGVISKDSRLQRPEFIGSTRGKMVISEVLQSTSSSLDTVAEGTPLGTMGGHGISVIGSDGFSYYATEHGWIIGLLSVFPRPAYQQGLQRKWSRNDRYDWFWPKFAHVGHQEILNKELYVEHPTAPDGVFGYIPRYSEYRYEPNRVAGEMRDTLNFWHLGRIFDATPALNETFLQASSASNRIFAVQYEGGGEDPYEADQIFGHIFNRISASRLIPKYGRPIL